MIACVLKSGGAYRPEHVYRVREQVACVTSEPFVCLTDMAIPTVETRLLLHGWPGWWSKLELFRPGVVPASARVLYLDLDTTIVGSLDDLLARPEAFLALRDFTKQGLGSGVMQWTAGDHDDLYEAFADEAETVMARCGRFGDQRFIDQCRHDRVTYWQDVVPGQIVSYKLQCQHGIPPEATVVVHHGHPKPWDLDGRPKLNLTRVAVH
jgi:hypothetical protein